MRYLCSSMFETTRLEVLSPLRTVGLLRLNSGVGGHSSEIRLPRMVTEPARSRVAKNSMTYLCMDVGNTSQSNKSLQRSLVVGMSSANENPKAPAMPTTSAAEFKR